MQRYGFSSSHVWIQELEYRESWCLKSWCFWTVVLEKILESLSDNKEIKAVNPKGNQSWVLIGRSDAKVETPILWPLDAESTHWKRSWCWERLRAEGEGDNRGWDGWMASLTQWTRVWASSGRWWRTGKLCMLQSLGLQRVGHSWVTERQQQTRFLGVGDYILHFHKPLVISSVSTHES